MPFFPGPILPAACYKPYATCYTHSTSGCPVARREDGLSGCTVEPCNLLSAPRYMLCPLCRWMPVFRDAGLRVQLQYPRAEDASPTLPVDAPSLGGMTARWGAPSSHATCYLHRATCYAHSAGGCPVFRDASLQVQLQYPQAEDVSPTLLVDTPSHGGMMAHRVHR
jgi:hypothetical protein